jgi:hypothetical protein
VRFEPYVLPKRSLSGDTTERVDTRVLHTIYAFVPGEFPAFVGLQVDVFIAARYETRRPAVRPRAKLLSGHSSTSECRPQAHRAAHPSPLFRRSIPPKPLAGSSGLITQPFIETRLVIGDALDDRGVSLDLIEPYRLSRMCTGFSSALCRSRPHPNVIQSAGRATVTALMQCVRIEIEPRSSPDSSRK